MTGAVCVRCRRWADAPVMVGTWASSTGAGWPQHAHPEGDPACGQPAAEQGGDEASAPDPLHARGEARGRHRRTSRILDDLPSWMPGGLVAAFGVARRHGVAVALAVLVWPIPGWLVLAPQVSDAIAGGNAGQSVPDPPPA